MALVDILYIILVCETRIGDQHSLSFKPWYDIALLLSLETFFLRNTIILYTSIANESMESHHGFVNTPVALELNPINSSNYYTSKIDKDLSFFLSSALEIECIQTVFHHKHYTRLTRF